MAVVNPLRYRGYYYDAESGWYYLQNRYYDPEVCRFINADSLLLQQAETIDVNLFMYCANSPISRFDYSGYSPLLVGLALVATTALIVSVSRYLNHKAKNKYNSDTVAITEGYNIISEDEKVLVNVNIYEGTNGKNFLVNESLNLQSPYEMDAVLDVIMESKYYNYKEYGSKEFMRTEWIAHNVTYTIATSGKIGLSIAKGLTLSSTPIQSSEKLDIRHLKNMGIARKIAFCSAKLVLRKLLLG